MRCHPESIICYLEKELSFNSKEKQVRLLNPLAIFEEDVEGNNLNEESLWGHKNTLGPE
jgi:hypothetical protein